MKILENILAAKGTGVVSIAPDAMVFDALVLMEEHNIGSLAVIQGAKLVGIITERDYVRKVILKGKSSKKTPVSDIMTSKVFAAKPQMPIEDAMALMNAKRIRHLPVKERSKLLGMVSMGDLVKATLAEKTFVIQQLEHYIEGELF